MYFENSKYSGVLMWPWNTFQSFWLASHLYSVLVRKDMVLAGHTVLTVRLDYCNGTLYWAAFEDHSELQLGLVNLF